MLNRPCVSLRHLALLLTVCASAAVTRPALAADASSPSAPAPKSQNVTINLINRMVERGLLPKEDAAELIKQAEDDAVAARAEAAAAQAAAVKAAVAQALAALPQPASVPATTPAAAPVADDTVRVTYIPGAVRRQIVEEVRQDVMSQAVAENWAAPRTFPDWAARLRLTGDLRFRFEGQFFPSGNDNTGAFPNFNSINTGSPFDTSGTVFSPQYNVDQPRDRYRLRARLGGEFDLEDGFTSGLRLATGENNSPVSENQSFGAANSAQGGNFSKYQVWLDRAFVKYEKTGGSGQDFALTLGRADNPFFATSIIWADELAFDGLVVQEKRQLAEGFKPYLTAGLFPVFNTDLNFATTQPAKFKSVDKWLYAAQTGADWEARPDVAVKFGVAYYDYQNIEGKLSDPFTPLTASDSGNTDATRPSFAQRGNTYMALRNITPSSLNGFGTTNQFQYFGLATPFRDVALTWRGDYSGFEPIQVTLLAEYVKNLAFNRGAIAAKAVNNLDGSGAFAGGDTAWIIGLKFGAAALTHRWDWNAGLNYRYVESDSVVDGFCDSDFGGGGTNVKGYTLSGALALSPRVWLSLRWMSSDQVAGPPLRADTLQLDFNAKF